MESILQLEKLTIALLQYIDQIVSHFERVKESGVQGDFYLEVKPFADKVKEVNDEWKELVDKFILELTPAHIKLQQVASAYDQMEMISVQAFFPQTSRTRFINNVKSIRYIYTTLLEIIPNK